MNKEDFIPGHQYIMLENGGYPRIRKDSIVTFIKQENSYMGLFSCALYEEVSINYPRLTPYNSTKTYLPNIQLYPLL